MGNQIALVTNVLDYVGPPAVKLKFDSKFGFLPVPGFKLLKLQHRV
jgi:hypothetical protein